MACPNSVLERVTRLKMGNIVAISDAWKMHHMTWWWEDNKQIPVLGISVLISASPCTYEGLVSCF